MTRAPENRTEPILWHYEAASGSRTSFLCNAWKAPDPKLEALQVILPRMPRISTD